MMSAGHRITILTGVSSDTVTQQDFDDKVAYLCGLGMAESYDDMTVVAGDVSSQKALYCKDNSVDIAIDNSKSNAKAMMEYVPCVLVPWASRT
jgi:hypothetical protein